MIPIGIAILASPPSHLGELRTRALRDGIDIVDFPTQGPQTTDYAEFGARVREVPTEGLSYVGVCLYGRRKAVGRIVGRLSLLKLAGRIEMRVHVVYAHPEPKSFCAAMKNTTVALLTEARHQVTVSDLYAERFNPVASSADFAMRRDARSSSDTRSSRMRSPRISRARSSAHSQPTCWFWLFRCSGFRCLQS